MRKILRLEFKANSVSTFTDSALTGAILNKVSFVFMQLGFFFKWMVEFYKYSVCLSNRSNKNTRGSGFSGESSQMERFSTKKTKINEATSEVARVKFCAPRFWISHFKCRKLHKPFHLLIKLTDFWGACTWGKRLHVTLWGTMRSYIKPCPLLCHLTAHYVK